MVYKKIGQHKIIVSYTFCKLSLYTVITYTNMVFQRQVIPHTIKTYAKSSFDNINASKLDMNIFISSSELTCHDGYIVCFVDETWET